ncbi:hypothetical protein [Paenarthrobacter aurescens]|nr:hypothetical protein [Paenarthrobacter aurescens]MCT9870691.1 hypothetical protein [Paenarthrobacter aurescens]
MPEDAKEPRFPTTEQVAEELNVSVNRGRALLKAICGRPGPGP